MVDAQPLPREWLPLVVALTMAVAGCLALPVPQDDPASALPVREPCDAAALQQPPAHLVPAASPAIGGTWVAWVHEPIEWQGLQAPTATKDVVYAWDFKQGTLRTLADDPELAYNTLRMDGEQLFWQVGHPQRGFVGVGTADLKANATRLIPTDGFPHGSLADVSGNRLLVELGHYRQDLDGIQYGLYIYDVAENELALLQEGAPTRVGRVVGDRLPGHRSTGLDNDVVVWVADNRTSPGGKHGLWHFTVDEKRTFFPTSGPVVDVAVGGGEVYFAMESGHVDGPFGPEVDLDTMRLDLVSEDSQLVLHGYEEHKERQPTIDVEGLTFLVERAMGKNHLMTVSPAGEVVLLHDDVQEYARSGPYLAIRDRSDGTLTVTCIDVPFDKPIALALDQAGRV